MKKIILFIILLFPISVLAKGNIQVSPSTLNVEVGSTKNFTIKAYHVIGDVTLVSNNESIATINTKEWSTGIVEEEKTTTGTISVTGKSIGTTTITLTLDAATFDSEDLSGQTRTITINVVPKSTTPNNNQNNNKSNNEKKSGWYNNTDNGVSNDSKEISTKIENITLGNGKLEFNKDVYEYNIDVGYDITKLDLDIKLEDDKASVKVNGNEELKVGLNVITIVVSGKDNKNSTYTLNVTRLDESSNSSLKSLKIKGYKIKFNKDKYEYYVNIKNEDVGNSLDIEAIPEDDRARVVVGGNKDISNGKYINIIVEAEDASTSMYTIKIINYNIGEFIYGIIGALISIIIISLIVIIKKKRK